MTARWITQVSRVLAYIAVFAIAVMLILIVADVLSRFIFKHSIPGVDAVVASYLMIAAIFLPLALLQMADENICIDILSQKMPDIIQSLFDVIANFLAIIFYGILAYLYTKTSFESYAIREFVAGTWNVPIWPARVIMPIGLAIGTIAAAVQCSVAIIAIFRGTPREVSQAGHSSHE